MKNDRIRDYIEFYFQVFDYLKNGLSAYNPLPPLHVYIEPTNVCNLNCPFCATSLLKRKRQNLDFDLYKKAIDSIVEQNWSGFIRLTFTGQGEPLLNNRLPDFVKYAKEKNFLSLEMITNGTKLNEEVAKKLIKNGLDRIQFSIDSIIKETYDVLRRPKFGNKSYFFDTMKNILNFLKLNSENNFPVYTAISAVLTSVNSNERNGFFEFWDSLPVDNIYFPPLSTLQNNNPSGEALRFAGNIKEKPTCIIPWITLSVKSNGEVVICSHDYHNTYPVGTIQSEDLTELWNNDRAKRLRESLINADLNHFVDIGHDCYSCNNPLFGCGREDFVKDIPVYMEKTVLGKLTKAKKQYRTKIRKLDEALKSLQ